MPGFTITQVKISILW